MIVSLGCVRVARELLGRGCDDSENAILPEIYSLGSEIVVQSEVGYSEGCARASRRGLCYLLLFRGKGFACPVH